MEIKNYEWLSKEGAPKMLVEALKLYGTKETVGKANNPLILLWAQEVGGTVAKDYTADSIPWCGLAMAIVAKRAEKEIPAGPLWALNWKNFGEETKEPGLGDILVFKRKTATGTAGHVGLYIGEDSECYHVLGGNQSDAFNIARVPKERLVAARRPDIFWRPNFK
jgi:uncharacterized protein (TIGR02594 family)